MIQLLDFEIIEKEQDEDSGDVYYTLKLDVLDPGAAYKE